MGPRPSQVVEDVGVRAAGVFKGVGEDRHPVKGFLVVDASGECENSGCQPTGFGSRGAKRIAKDVAYQTRLAQALSRYVSGSFGCRQRYDNEVLIPHHRSDRRKACRRGRRDPLKSCHARASFTIGILLIFCQCIWVNVLRLMPHAIEFWYSFIGSTFGLVNSQTAPGIGEKTPHTAATSHNKQPSFPVTRPSDQKP